MYRVSYMAAAAITAVAGAQTASAQLTLGVDVNGFEYAFTDGGGSPGFGGVNHTGTVRWSISPGGEPRIVNARLGDEGPFGPLESVPLGAGLSDFDGVIELESGRIQSGSLTVLLDNGDSYTADFGAGGLMALDRGGFTLDGLTLNGAFSDDEFGDIDVSEFNALDNLPGWVLKFRFNPTASEPSGTADAEVFVLVPLPPTALAGLGMLAGVMGLTVARRRRMA